MHLTQKTDTQFTCWYFYGSYCYFIVSPLFGLRAKVKRDCPKLCVLYALLWKRSHRPITAVWVTFFCSLVLFVRRQIWVPCSPALFLLAFLSLSSIESKQTRWNKPPHSRTSCVVLCRHLPLYSDDYVTMSKHFFMHFFPRTNGRENISILNNFPFFCGWPAGRQQKKIIVCFLNSFPPPPFLTGEKKKKKILVSCYFPTRWYIRPCVCLIWPW